MPPLRESAADSSGAVSTPKIVGPTRPPTQLQSENEHLQPENNTDSSDSSDDDFGPQLPPSGNTASTRPETQTESRVPRSTSDDATDAAATRKRQRDDWMLKPPENSSWASGMNPTAIKNRKFTSGRSVRGDRNTDGASSVWTEDPAQKRQRLENEVLGIKSESSTSSARSKDLSTRTNQATAEKLKSLTSSTAKSSLYESHKKEKQKVEEDDPSKRAFDYEKDVAGKTSISSGAHAQYFQEYGTPHVLKSLHDRPYMQTPWWGGLHCVQGLTRSLNAVSCEICKGGWIKSALYHTRRLEYFVRPLTPLESNSKYAQQHHPWDLITGMSKSDNCPLSGRVSEALYFCVETCQASKFGQAHRGYGYGHLTCSRRFDFSSRPQFSRKRTTPQLVQKVDIEYGPVHLFKTEHVCKLRFDADPACLQL